MSQHLGIAGAGLIGRLLAWQLARQGFRVTLFDRDKRIRPSAAAFTAAGMLTPYTELESAEALIYTLGMRSLELWPNYLSELGGEVRYNNKGSLIVSHPDDEPELRHFKAQLNHKLGPGSQRYEQLTRPAVQELEPQLASQFDQAVYLPEEAWVSTDDLMEQLEQQLLALGVDWQEETAVDDISPHTIHAAGRQYQFDWVLDCRGTGAKPQWNEIRGVRGELIRLEAPEVALTRMVRLMHPRYRLYVVPLGRDSQYIIGATQIESEDYSPISVRSCLELLSAAYAVHPGFAEARIVETRTNCRPALKDNLPRVEICDGLVRVNGLFRHGYLLAPAITEAVTSALVKNASPCDNLLKSA